MSEKEKREETEEQNDDFELSNSDIMDLDEESLRKLSTTEADEDESDQDAADEDDESTTDDDESTTDENESTTDENESADESEEADKSDESTTAENEDESESTTEVDGEDSGKTGDPLKDTQKAYHKKAEEAAKLKKENLELKKKLHEANAPEKPADMSKEQLEEMARYEPEKYADYLYKKKLYDQNKEVYEQKSKELDQQDAQIAQQLAAEKTEANVYEFASQVLPKEVRPDPGKTWDKQPKEFQELMNSEAMQKTLKVIDKNPDRYYEKEDGSISAETIRMVYRDVAFDDLAVGERKKASQNTVNNMERAAATKSGLDKASQGGTSQDSRQKKAEDMDEEEIHNLGPQELADLLAEQGL